MKILKDQNELTFLLMLLAVDSIFIIVYLIHAYTPYASGDYYKLNMDRGYSEIFQYVFSGWSMENRNILRPVSQLIVP
ncbi:MAG TPA: hypothetical protein VGL11_08260 [Candidatus Binatia bacterium]|jgi:hypothetical protein